MANQPRVAKVLLALLVSMTTGAVVLMALNGAPPSAGPFCLSSYYRLNPISQAIRSNATQQPERWDIVEIYYSGTKAGSINQLASLSGVPAENLNCHFVIGNGLGADDGEIQPTERWQKQWAIIPGSSWYGTAQTIRICVINDSTISQPTDFQVKRTQALVEALARRFQIKQHKIYYPANWR